MIYSQLNLNCFIKPKKDNYITNLLTYFLIKANKNLQLYFIKFNTIKFLYYHLVNIVFMNYS